MYLGMQRPVRDRHDDSAKTENDEKNKSEKYVPESFDLNIIENYLPTVKHQNVEALNRNCFIHTFFS
jgi:hypothetical protein